jgi:DNA-binding SARP family transcriptional activator/TolB-like protein
LSVDGHDVAISGRKARALIGHLAMSERLEATRERIVGLLWSESDEERARASLRQSLVEIRRALSAAGFLGLNSDKQAIGFASDTVQIDLADVLEEAHHGRAHPLLIESQRPIDNLLAEFETVDDSFRDWLRAKRQSITNTLMRQLEGRMRCESATADVRRNAARALLNLEPSNEEAARVLIESAIATGDIGAAFSIYQTLCDLLWDTYEVKPSEETQDLIASLRQSQGEDQRPVQARHARLPLLGASGFAETAHGLIAGTTARTRPLPPKLVVSIMPFDATQVSEDSHYRVQGFRRELMACLVRFREWQVCDPALALEMPTQSAARQSEYLIEASATEDGPDLRLAMTLREAGSDVYLWSERLKLSMQSWFEAQEHIVRRLATAVNVHVSAERMSALALREPANLKAYDMWLLAQATLNRMDATSWERARKILLEVIAQAPGFAPAYSSLAQLNNSRHIAMAGVMRDRQRTEEALAYAREAQRLDPIDSRSQLCLGWSHAMAKQYEQATLHMSLAHELNDNDGWTLISSANCLAFCAEYEKAAQMARHALALSLAPSPLQWSYQTAIRFMIGDYAGCIEAANAAGDHVNPNVPAWRSAALFHLGYAEPAAEQVAKFIELTRRRWAGDQPATDELIIRWLL